MVTGSYKHGSLHSRGHYYSANMVGLSFQVGCTHTHTQRKSKSRRVQEKEARQNESEIQKKSKVVGKNN